MFVAVDEENKRVFGPFSDEVKADAWVQEYIANVEYPSTFRALGRPDTINIDEYLWNIHEVVFVDEDDRAFAQFLSGVKPAQDEGV